MKARRGRRLLFAAVLVGVNIAALGGLYGVFLSVTERWIERQRASTLLYDVHGLQRQVLLPNQTYALGEVRFGINEYGMRGAAPSLPKPKGMCRVIAVGGSSVFDHLASEGESWPERLAPALRGLGVENVETFNAGVPGFSSRETLAYYHDRVRYLEPDVVVVYLGWNDVKYIARFVESVDVDGYFALPDWRDKYGFLLEPPPLRNLRALGMMWRARRGGDVALEGTTDRGLADSLRRRVVGGRPTTSAPSGSGAARGVRWESTPGVGYFRHNVAALVREVLADGAVPVLVAENTLATRRTPESLRKRIAYQYVGLDHEGLLEVNAAVAAVLRRVAAEQGVPFVDLRAEMNGKRPYFNDHVHMRPAGSARFAELLARELAAIIRERRGAGGGATATFPAGGG